jgi:hypothetical protein
MQKGRGYRHAIPRNNLNDNLYNQRIPWRWNVVGPLRSGLLILNVTQPAHVVFGTYDGATISWPHGGTIHWNGLPIICTTEFREIAGTGNHRFEIKVDDGVGSTLTHVWLLDWGVFGPGINFAWPFAPPSFTTITGTLWQAGGLQVTPVIYADEP